MPRLSVEEIQRAALLRKLEDEARILENVNSVKKHHRQLLDLKESHRVKAEDRKMTEKNHKRQEKERTEANRLRTTKAMQDRTSSIREARKSGTTNAKQNFEEGNKQKRLDEQIRKNQNAAIRAGHAEIFRAKARSIKADVDRTTRRIAQRRASVRESAAESARDSRQYNIDLRNSPETFNPEEFTQADHTILEQHFSNLSIAQIDLQTADTAHTQTRRDARMQTMNELRKQIENNHQATINKAQSAKRRNMLERAEFERRQKEDRARKIEARKSHQDKITLEVRQAKQEMIAKNKAIVAEMKNCQATSPRNRGSHREMQFCLHTPTKQMNRRYEEPSTPPVWTPTTMSTPTRLREQGIQEAQQRLRRLKEQNISLVSKAHDSQRKRIEKNAQSL